MMTVLVLAAISAFVTQVAKRYLAWAVAQPQWVALAVSFAGAFVVLRVIAWSWFLTGLLAAFCAVGIYEWGIRPFVKRAA